MPRLPIEVGPPRSPAEVERFVAVVSESLGYTGCLGAEQAVSVGLARGSATPLARASQTFAGPSPWMAEIF